MRPKTPRRDSRTAPANRLAAATATATARMEPLEGRQLMSTTTLTGSAGDNTFTLAQPLAAGDTIVIDGKGGHDKLVIAAAFAEQVKGKVVLKNPAGTFDVDVDNHLANSNRSLKVGRNQIVGAAAATIDYANAPLRTVKIQLDKLGAAHQIFDTRAGSTLEVVAAKGLHQFTLGDAGSTAGLKGKVKLVNNTTGVLDAVRATLDDSADKTARTVTVTATGVTGLGTTGLDFVKLSQLTVKTGKAADTVNVQSTSSETRLASAAGADKVNVGKNGLIGGLAGQVVVQSAVAGTEVTVDDSSDTADRQFTLGAGSVGVRLANGANSNFLTYVSAAHLTLKTGTKNDVVTVFNTTAGGATIRTGGGNDLVGALASGGPLSVDGGAGRDLLSLGGRSDDNRLSKFHGDVTLNAGKSAGDTVAILDDAETVGRSYVVTNGFVQRTDLPGKFSYAASELFFNAGSGNDTIGAFSVTDGSTKRTYSAGDGRDDVFGGPAAERISGGGGDDRITPGEGADEVDAGTGNDVVFAGDDGKDTLEGDGQDDVVHADGVEGQITGFVEVVRVGTVTGTVFNDKNANGFKDAGEGAFPAFSQTFIDLDGNGSLTGGDPGANVKADGTYKIFDVPLKANLKVFALLGGNSVQTVPGPKTPFRTVNLSAATPKQVGVDFGGRLIATVLAADKR